MRERTLMVLVQCLVEQSCVIPRHSLTYYILLVLLSQSWSIFVFLKLVLLTNVSAR